MSDSNHNDKHYEVTQRQNYIYLQFKGEVEAGDLHASTDEITTIAEEEKIYLLLDDIRGLDRTNITIQIQTEAIGLLWHLRIFKKIALLYKDDEVGRLVKTTLETVPFMSKCHAFDNETEAIAWLLEDA